MKVIIPVAGIGKRLRPHTYSLPKPLLHVAGRPIIAHLLDPVERLKPEEVIFVVGYRGDEIQEYITETYQFKSTFVEQDKLLGLGYALNLALQQVDGGEVLILLGDTVVECDLKKFVAAGENVIGLLPVEDPQRFGIAVTENGRIVDLEEKPPKPKTNLAVIGLYYFKDATLLKSVLQEHVESGSLTRGEVQFTDALQQMITRGAEMTPHEVKEWFDCGKKETMLSTNEHLLNSKEQTTKLPGSVIVPPVYVHPEAIVERSILGPNVSISAGSAVRDSLLRHTIVGCNSTIEGMMLEDSLVGNQVILQGKRQSVNIGDASEVITE